MPPNPQVGHVLKSFGFESRSPAGEIDADVHRKIIGECSKTNHISFPMHAVSESMGMTIAAITTLLRVALRFKRFWWDDGLALAALALLIVTAATESIYYNIQGTASSAHANK